MLHRPLTTQFETYLTVHKTPCLSTQQLTASSIYTSRLSTQQLTASSIYTPRLSTQQLTAIISK